jgi:MSHA biogenesis protein MshI
MIEKQSSTIKGWQQWLAKKCPSYMPVVTKLAVAIEAQGLSIAQIKYPAKKPVLGFCEYLANYSNQIEKLKKILQSHKIKAKACYLVLGPTLYHSFLIERPAVGDKELRPAISWRVIEYIDQNPESLLIDYIEMPMREQSHSKQMLLVVVVQKALIEEKLNLLNKLKLKPVAIDVAGLALRNLIHQLPVKHNSQAILKIDATQCQLVIVRNGMTLLLRDLEISHFAIVQGFKDPASNGIQKLALEIQRSLDYCSTYIMDASRANIIILPEPEFDSALIDNLAQVLGMPVNFFNQAAIISEQSAQALPVDLAHCWYAIGGALRGSK